MIEHSSPVLHPLRGSFLSTHFFFFCYHCILALHCLPLLEILGSFHVYGVSGTHVSVTASELTGSSPPTLFHFIYRGAAMYLTNSTLPNMPLATFSFSFFFFTSFLYLNLSPAEAEKRDWLRCRRACQSGIWQTGFVYLEAG